MKKVNVDELFEGKASRHALVIGVAKRARQITQEFVDQEIITDEKSVLLAIDEIKNHKINILEPEDEDL
jgi:DNA-directed RNA polymerase subunit omega